MAQLPEHHEDHPATISRNGRIGLALFVVYFALYAGFLLLNVLAPQAMSDNIIPLIGDRYLHLGGTNLAVVYGIGLILFAIILSLLYMRMTKQPRTAVRRFPTD